MRIRLFLTLLIILLLVWGRATTFAASEDFTDVPPSHPNYTAIMYFKNLGVLEGYSDGTFRPNKIINRVSALKVVLLASNMPLKSKMGTGGFSDTDASAWYAKYILAGVKQGVVHGYPDGSFRPAKAPNVVEILKVLLSAQNVETQKVEPTQAWYVNYLEYAKEKNLVQVFSPKKTITRSKLAEIMYRLIYIRENKLEAYPGSVAILPSDYQNPLPRSYPALPKTVPVVILYGGSGSGSVASGGGSTSSSSGSTTSIVATPPPLPPLAPAQPPAPTAGLSLKVVGNQLVDADENPVRLLGVNRSGQEFKCIQSGVPGLLGWGIFDGPTDLASAQAIASWHANTVRIPLNEDCWLGINGVNPQWGGAAYQDAIKAYVDTLHQAGLYVILDLHWNAPDSIPAAAQQPMPDADHAIDFWTSVATAFASDPATVFDLYNEPFIYGSYLQDPAQDPWDCWLNGCTFNQYLTGGNPYTQAYDWKAVGMQTLVDTVRKTGATNVIMIGGLEWANDLTGWLAYKPTDPENALVAAWHSYPGQICSDQACWDSVIAPVAAQVPIVIGEVGDSVCTTVTYLPALLTWADAHGLSYLGWTWNTWGDCNYVLIKDYAGTPTDNYGQIFRDWLLSVSS